MSELPVWPKPVAAHASAPTTVAQGPENLARPDEASAAAAARLTGKRIEVTGLTTEFSKTWALPEGGFTSEVYAGPVRFHDSTGAWKDVDLTLRRAADGSVEAAGHPYGLRISGAVGDGHPPACRRP